MASPAPFLDPVVAEPSRSTPRHEVAHVLRDHASGLRLIKEQARAVRDIVACRTETLGGHIEECPGCDFSRGSYNSCRNRHCPKCQILKQVLWAEAQEALLPPTMYFQVVFTIPHQLHPFFRRVPKVCLTLLFEAVSETLTAVAQTKLKATIGFTAVLHTWNQQLGFHPHLHCVVPAGHSPGDTKSARSAFYELTRINEQARGWLPNNAWLATSLRAETNATIGTCGASWSGTTVRFLRSGTICRNPGEIAGVFDHEWGHGLDDNGVNPTISNPAEGIADVHAILRLNASCVGRGFLRTLTCGGYGDPCTVCTGVRDADWARRASGLPHGLPWIDANCGSGFAPCGGGVHCEGAVVSESAWDLAQRDFRGFAGSVFDYDLNTALELTTRLFYIGAGPVASWYQCTNPHGGCQATGGYLNLLAADDDNGNLADGTPHMTAIFAAFNRHDIACATPAPANSGCAAGPAAAPALTAVPLDQGASLSWTAAPNAARYYVFRTEGVHGADFGKAKIAEVTGTVSFGRETKGKRRLVITGESSERYEELIPKWRQLNVFEGEHVERGEVIAEGEPNPHDILRLQGVAALANYLTREIQDVYRLQGVKINDKHIEVIVRQMLRKVEVKDAGDSTLLRGEQLERARILELNDRLEGAKKKPAEYEPMLLGITKASLQTDSFISAASFQETTRVLTEAAIMGKKDDLRGLKENVIVGRLIPAGTGLAYHKTRQNRGQKEEIAIEELLGEPVVPEVVAGDQQVA